MTKILKGKWEGEEMEVSIYLSSSQIELGRRKNPEWKPDPKSPLMEDTQFEREFLVRWKAFFPADPMAPQVEFCFRSHRGGGNWICLEMLLQGMEKEKVERLRDFCRKVESRIHHSWKTQEWRNIRGLKILAGRL